MDFLILIGLVGIAIAAFVGVPAAALIGISMLVMRRRGSAPVWPMFAATVIVCTGVMVGIFESNIVAAVVAYAIFLLPVPLMLDLDHEPGERLVQRGLIVLGTVLGVAVVLAALVGPLVAGLFGIELP